MARDGAVATMFMGATTEMIRITYACLAIWCVVNRFGMVGPIPAAC